MTFRSALTRLGILVIMPAAFLYGVLFGNKTELGAKTESNRMAIEVALTRICQGTPVAQLRCEKITWSGKITWLARTEVWHARGASARPHRDEMLGPLADDGWVNKGKDRNGWWQLEKQTLVLNVYEAQGDVLSLVMSSK